jgi:hypothetical protein
MIIFNRGPKVPAIAGTKYLYSRLVWNHIVGTTCSTTKSLHVLLFCIKKPENESAVTKGYIYSGTRYTLLGQRVHFPVFEYRRSVHVKTLL